MRDISMVLCHSDKTSKHLDCQCLQNAKETMHFGGTDYLYEIGIYFWHISKLVNCLTLLVNCFGRQMSFCRWTMVLCWTILVILAKAPRVLIMSGLFREMSQSNWEWSFAFWWHWLFIWERNLIVKHMWTVLGAIWAFASELWCCAEL